MTLLTRLSVGLFCDEKSFIIHTKFADERIEHRHRRYSDIRGQESLVDATPLELFDSQAVFEFFKKSFDLFCQFAWVTISLTRGKFLFLYSLCSWMNENDIMGKLNKKGRRIKNHFILPSGIAMDSRWVWRELHK